MNIINKLTVRHLKKNKRRTLVTIFGVIISVAMITAVATLGVSFIDIMKRQSIAENGDWHVQYKDVNREQLEAIEKDAATSKLVISKDNGYASLEGSDNESKPYLFIKGYNQNGFETFPIDLSSGRLPKSAQELVMNEEVRKISEEKYELGDKVTLSIGQRKMVDDEVTLTQNDPLQLIDGEVQETLDSMHSNSYTIVGFIKRPTWEPTWSPGYTAITYIDQSALGESDKVNAIVTLDKVSNSLFKHSEQLAEEHDIENIGYNDALLRLYGVTDNDSLRTTLFSLVGIIMVVIFIGSVALIYNAFAISVSERSRHLGMLASVGATKKQKRNSVFFEGAIIGLISIPIGVIAGLGGMAITFYFINTFIDGALGISQKFKVIATPMSILVACVVSIVTIFISTYSPARRASKVSAIDAIRQTHDVKLTEKKVKTSKLVRKLFGIEAEIGLKNLKRNKKRYQATVFSLVISIVLFLSVSYFTESLEKSLELSQQNINYDIQIASDKKDTTKLETLAEAKYITDHTILQEISLRSWISEEGLPEKLKENLEQDSEAIKNGKYPYDITLSGLDQNSFKEYAEKVGVDLSSTTDAQTLKAIIINKVSYQDPNSRKLIETRSIHTKIGESLVLESYDYETEESEQLGNVEVVALTDIKPMGIDAGYLGALDVIVNNEDFNQLVKDNNITSSFLFLTSSDPMETQADIENLKDSNMYVYNVFKNRQQEEQLILLLSVFAYGFIALITAISVANIFNTISTSISLRKREFAMLKSVGMTPKGFNRMINYESIFYGIKALVYGIPISIVVMGLIYWSLMGTFEYNFEFPWLSALYVGIAIFIVVGSAMLYSAKKVKKENIIDALKQESI
ncbi:ABC transporter permease [Aquibacillus kalidii]|uniref:ABC transporter permease n=1 Tax=Aquibacillus kalidii TaxID=2762597 RepID=UPI001644A3EE|nr:ABC transporter permease [Aquibacillus kalidii]